MPKTEMTLSFPITLYTYAARYIRTIDGDTYVLDVDLGWKTHVEKTIRLHGWNTPEKYARFPKDHPQAGQPDEASRELARKATLAAEQWFRHMSTESGHVIVHTTLDRRGDTDIGKYGRTLGDVYPGWADEEPKLEWGAAQYKSLGQHLHELGYAERTEKY